MYRRTDFDSLACRQRTVKKNKTQSKKPRRISVDKLGLMNVVGFLLRYDARSVRSDVEVHGEWFHRSKQSLISVLLDTEAALERAVTESTERDFYQSTG